LKSSVLKGQYRVWKIIHHLTPITHSSMPIIHLPTPEESSVYRK
jgi:hypothetical protein